MCFLLAPADKLTAVATGSVDVVTTRSVLIYVKDKAGALQEFYRVLKPGGRISLFEPINVLMSDGDPGRFGGYDTRSVRALTAKVLALYESIQPRGEDPMVDFDERDLLAHAEEAGFWAIDLDLRVTVKNAKRAVPWERLLRMSGNPLSPPLGEARRAYTSISIFIRGSARPHISIVAAGRTSPNARRRTGQQGGKSSRQGSK